jgi:HK97 family phage major capsid protein
MAVNVTRASFDGSLWPPELRDLALKTIIGGAPFADSITRTPTGTGSVVYPLIDPTGAGWVAEGAPLPDVNLNDDRYTVATHKLAGILEFSNESISDTAYNLDGQVSTALVDAFSHQMDTGLLTGTGDANNQPTGVVSVAPVATASASLLTATANAKGEIGDAGGTPDSIALSFTLAASEGSAATTDGLLKYPAGLEAALGLRIVQVPGLATPIVYDSTRVHLVVRDDFSIEQSEHAAWRTDGISLRVKGRFAVAVPTPGKAIRKLNLAP